MRGTQHAVGRHRREHALGLLCRDQLQWEAEGLGPPGLARKLLHALRARGQAERADLVPAGFQADLVAQGAIEVDRIHHHPRQAERAAQLPDEAGGVEGRAAGESRSLDEHRVRPAESRQPVEDGHAAHASADHNRAGAIPQFSAFTLPPPLRGGGKPEMEAGHDCPAPIEPGVSFRFVSRARSPEWQPIHAGRSGSRWRR